MSSEENEEKALLMAVGRCLSCGSGWFRPVRMVFSTQLKVDASKEQLVL
ncbi:5656_t:CDS:2 [Dentiscutata erythropus]|uniref:5656_t:CDS:1 n=1 Tax=Dentiscutata erythropus TaxID=1348616 RepID=A0A9N9IBP8_9GLOM|nr:5656_t:CDS:2 [Dentiscutata erythropus]